MRTASRSRQPGHVFLAFGRIETIVHDATVIPTDHRFSVRKSWSPLLGKRLERARPPDWPAAYARSATHDNVWFIDVGDIVRQGTATLTARAVELLSAITDSQPPIGRGRRKLRVAMPVLSIAGGGMAARQGEVIRTLMESLDQAAHDLDIDVVLVTPDRSVFSAAQHARRELNPWPIPRKLLGQARTLGRMAEQGHLALFLGAGVSVSAGLPTWTGLLEELAEQGGIPSRDLVSLPPLDQAQLLERRLGPQLGKHVATITKRARRPSLAHTLLAGLGCFEVATTNYDRLYETAVRATGQPITSVLPWKAVAAGQPWVLKMHGDVGRPDSIVLTRRQFVRYDASTRPAGSLLQSLLLTKHLLVVGASLNDDNVSRLTHEVDDFRRDHGVTRTFGTFLDVDGTPARRELWSDQLNWISFSGATVDDRVRNMEIFLDAIAAHATTDASWLLDPRFEGLLTDSGKAVAAEARQLHARAARRGPSMAALTDALTTLGADAHPHNLRGSGPRS